MSRDHGQGGLEGAVRLAGALALLAFALAGCNTDLEDAQSAGSGTEDSAADSGEPSDVTGDDVSDTGDTGDTDEPPDVTGPTTSVGVVNACGGSRELLWRGEPAELLTPCGAFEEGRLVCDGSEAVRCMGEVAVNVCGGQGALSVQPGESCGCGGVWVCGASGMIACLGSTARNACGGCGALAGWPGDRCDAAGEVGTLLCDGGDDLRCAVGVFNACGGTSELETDGAPAGPGQACESACGEGLLVCADEVSLACVPEGGVPEANACGGCEQLPGDPRAACGACGEGAWECTPQSALRCVGDALPDACGSCSGQDVRPGDACDAGEWRCAAGSLVCVDALPGQVRNACGGTSALEGVPGEHCGACELGAWTCDSAESLRCVGDQVNACGGCAGLVAEEGAACGTCASGELACGSGEEAGALVCVDDGGEEARNACGGCGELAAAPGGTCGECAEWTCEGGRLRCVPVTDTPDCAGVLACADLACRDEGRLCQERAGFEDARCVGCRSGYVERGGHCTPAASSCTVDAECAAGSVCGSDPEGEGGRCVPSPQWSGAGLRFALVPGTRQVFDQGSPEGETGRQAAREALVGVELIRDYWVAETPVTDAQWAAVMGEHNTRFESSYSLEPSGALTGECAEGSCPAIRVNWWEAVLFANAASALEGLETCYVLEDCTSGSSVNPGAGCSGTDEDCGDLTFRCEAVERMPECTGYRLPTEAEWEWAVRAGTTTATWAGDLPALSCGNTAAFLGPLAWYACTLPIARREVAQLAANPFGLRDMLGNVWEWTWDAFADDREGGVDPAGPEWPNQRAQRGGSYRSNAEAIRAARRQGADPLVRFRDVGIRLVRSVPPDDAVRCPELATPDFTYLEVTGTRPGDRASSTCFLGWPSAGSAERLCAADGVWTGEQVRCAPAPPACDEDSPCPDGWWCGVDADTPLCAPRPELAPDIHMPFVTIPSGGGRFLMGSPTSEPRRVAAREGQVEVSLTNNLWMQRTPMTVAQWRAIVEWWNAEEGTSFSTEPGACDEDECPVTRVNAHEAAWIANALSVLHGLEPCYVIDDCEAATSQEELGAGCGGPFSAGCESRTFECATLTFEGPSCTGYRLPTEAEWEYAVRAGTATARWYGDGLSSISCAQVDEDLWAAAWFSCTTSGGPEPVGTKAPNPWGLFDMFGNVTEWTWNWFAEVHTAGEDPVGPESPSSFDNLRTTRGGTAEMVRGDMRAAARFPFREVRRGQFIGLRLVRTIGEDDVE